MKLLLSNKNGVKAIKIVSKILDIHKGKFDELLSTNIRVLGNTHIILELLAMQLADSNEIIINSFRE